MSECELLHYRHTQASDTLPGLQTCWRQWSVSQARGTSGRSHQISPEDSDLEPPKLCKYWPSPHLLMSSSHLHLQSGPAQCQWRKVHGAVKSLSIPKPQFTLSFSSLYFPTNYSFLSRLKAALNRSSLGLRLIKVLIVVC